MFYHLFLFLQPSYLNWNFAEPNNADNYPEDCVSMFPQSYKKGKWSTGYCGQNYGFICEKTRPASEYII